jgi:hypothetical protein
MSAPLVQPLKRLERIIGNRLNNISEKMSVEELSKINTFMDEARKLHKSMWDISNPVTEEGGDTRVDDDDYTNFLFNGLVEACNIIVSLYQLMDDEKLKTLDLEWVVDDTKAFMEHVREGIGYRIPELPPYRLVSKKKKK